MTLRIDTIKLENYRQYKDATIEFSRDPPKGCLPYCVETTGLEKPT